MTWEPTPDDWKRFRAARRKLDRRLKDGHGIVPIPAICTGRGRHEWLDGGPNGAIRAPSLKNCMCFWCGKPLKRHPNYPEPKPVRRGESRQLAMEIEA